jgi:phosphomannomutase
MHRFHLQVNYMPHYASTLKTAILKEVGSDEAPEKALEGLRIVLNTGNGSGGFFHKVLEELGADVSASIHVEPDGAFPAYIPNPESSQMIAETTRVCEEANADIGIMLDTDADRCGFVVPRSVNKDGTRSDYEALNRNRLIALLGVIFSKTSPGCAIVTDSVTSEGLETFLQDDLGLQHVRYLKGYANVINKARELTEAGIANAEVAIETSGHCAMQENGYLDDGTYTAVKVIGLLARVSRDTDNKSVLDLISNLKEMPEEGELRMPVLDETLQTTSALFDFMALEIEQLCQSGIDEDEDRAVAMWSLDEDNLEGIRVRTGKGGFFMLRKSLHDPVISLQVEGTSREQVRECVVDPLLELFDSEPQSRSALNLNALEAY